MFLVRSIARMWKFTASILDEILQLPPLGQIVHPHVPSRLTPCGNDSQKKWSPPFRVHTHYTRGDPGPMLVIFVS